MPGRFGSAALPAVRAIDFAGTGQVLERLRAVGFVSLDKSADFYGDGLALGNGEVTLFELVQAYSALAGRGVFKKLRLIENDAENQARRVFSPETASLLADILSDQGARKLTGGLC